MADANELQRIFLLKSAGVKEVLADINAITEAFEASAQAKAKLMGDKGMFDDAQMGAVNRQMAKMVELQEDLLAVVKTLNPEIAKTAGTLNSTSTASQRAADGIDELVTSTKSLGTGLVSASNALLRVQGVLNTNKITDYNDAMLSLAETLNTLWVEKERLNVEMRSSGGGGGLVDFLDKHEADGITLQGEKMMMGKIEVKALTSEYLQLKEGVDSTTVSTEEYLVALSQVNSRINEVRGAMNFLNKEFNSALNTPAGGFVASAKDRDALNNQKMRGEAWAASIEGDLPENAGARKAAQQLTRAEIEQKKNETIAINENASAYQKLVAELNIAKAQLKIMYGTAVQGTAVWDAQVAKVKALDAEYKAFNKQMGNNQVEVGNYGLVLKGVGNVTTMFVRQLARGVGSLIIWGLLFDALKKTGDEIAQLIPGTDLYIQEQDKLRQVNEDLVKSFEGIIDVINKEQQALEIFDLYANSGTAEGIKATIDMAQRTAEMAKAAGVLDGEVGKADLEQLKTANEAREQELVQLRNKLDISTELLRVSKAATDVVEQSKKLIDSGYSMTDVDATGRLKGVFNNAKLPKETKENIFTQIDKFVHDASDAMSYVEKQSGKTVDLAPLIEKLKKQFVVDDVTIRSAIDKTQTQSDVSTEALAAKNRELVYAKTVDLQKELQQLHETTRQLKEKEDIESVDKIVADTTAKYKAMYIAIQKSEDDYIKAYSGDKKDPRYLKTLAMYALLLGGNIVHRDADAANQAYELTLRQHAAYEAESTSLSSGRSGISKFDADYGQANYGRMAKALDDEMVAKKKAIETQFETEASKIESSDLVIEAQKQKDQRLEDVDKEMYVKRLGLAMAYYKKLESIIDVQTQIVVDSIDAHTASKITAIYKKAGLFTDVDTKVSKTQRIGGIERMLAQLNDAKAKLRDVNAAEADANANSTAAGLSNDTDAETEAEKERNKVLAEKARILKQINELERDIAKLEHEGNNKDYIRAVAQGLLDIAQTLSDSYFQLLQKQEAYRNEMLHRSMQWNELVMRSEVQSSNERLAQQKATILANQEIQREQAIRDKHNAERQVIINTVIASGKALASDAGMGPGWLIKYAIDEGVILAEAAIQESMLSRAPAYAEGIGIGNGTHPGGPAWVGDGGEHEFIISPKTATLMNLAAGSSVIPFSKMSGDLGTSLKAPSFSYTSTTAGADNALISVHEASINHLYGMMNTVANHLSNLEVVYDPRKAQKSALNLSYRSNRPL